MDLISKAQFINNLKESYINIQSVSDRRIDYKYLEYNLFIILMKHRNEHDFTELGIPENLEINIFRLNGYYDILKQTHVTLNAELFRLYRSGYFKESEFIDYVIITINRYKSGIAKIVDLVNETRRMRLDYEKMLQELKQY